MNPQGWPVVAGSFGFPWIPNEDNPCAALIKRGNEQPTGTAAPFPGKIGISSRLSLKLCLGVINFQAGINAAPGEVSLNSGGFSLCLRHPQFLGNGLRWDLSVLVVGLGGPARTFPGAPPRLGGWHRVEFLEGSINISRKNLPAAGAAGTALGALPGKQVPGERHSPGSVFCLSSGWLFPALLLPTFSSSSSSQPLHVIFPALLTKFLTL